MGVRVLQRPAPHVEESMGHWGREGHKKGEKRGHCAKKCRKHRSGRFIRCPALLPFGVPVETRWGIGTVHQIYRVIQNVCGGFNDLSYTIHLRYEHMYFFI